MELRPLTVTIPQAAPVAVIAGTDSLGLVERLLLLRLHFLITSVLWDKAECRRRVSVEAETPGSVKFLMVTNIWENTHKE